MTETYQKLYALFRKLQKIAELESQLLESIDDLKHERISHEDLFFLNYGHDESSLKDIALLCFIQDVEFDASKPQTSIETLTKAVINESITLDSSINQKILKMTSHLIHSITLRIDLLLQVSIESTKKPLKNSPRLMFQSLQSWPTRETRSYRKQMSFDVEQFLDDSILQIPKLRIQRKVVKNKDSKQNLKHDTSFSSNPILDEIFEFIGSYPEKSISPWKFLEVVNNRKAKSISRKYSLMFVQTLLSCEMPSNLVSPVIEFIIPVINFGPRLNELTCGGLIEKVQEAYGDVLKLLVEKIGENSENCLKTILYLCKIPFERSEESCIVKSGLVNLLDSLCSSQKSMDSNTAWESFKILTDRCMKWQEESSKTFAQWQERGLAYQISRVLISNLSTASENDDLVDHNFLEEILKLLIDMSNTKLGRDILCQPSCISKMLSLLLESSISPRLLQTIIKLCNIALPMMPPSGFRFVNLPNWFQGRDEVELSNDNPQIKIIYLLFAKLADFLVPGSLFVASKGNPYSTKKSYFRNTKHINHNEDVSVVQNLESLKMTLYIHKRPGQSSSEILQQIIDLKSDIEIFSDGAMENVVTIDNELNVFNKAKIITDESTKVKLIAEKLSEEGFVTSLNKPTLSDLDLNERIKLKEEKLKRQNCIIMKTDPIRPFLSSSNANDMANELITLIHSLFSSQTSTVWDAAITEYIVSVLNKVENIIVNKHKLFSGSEVELFNIYKSSKEIIAVLAVMGGFNETLKSGLQVRIKGDYLDEITYEITHISETEDLAVVKLIQSKHFQYFPRPSDEINISLKRLEPLKKTSCTKLFSNLEDDLIKYISLFFMPDDVGVEFLSAPLPSLDNNKKLTLETSRLIAELRTKSMQVFNEFIAEQTTAIKFLSGSCQTVDLLKYLCSDTYASDRLDCIENSVIKMRNLYRDCDKPSIEKGNENSKKNRLQWDLKQNYPPLQHLSFCDNYLTVKYHSDLSHVSNLPRGNYIYASQPVDFAEKYFYWETTILSMGDTATETGYPALSIGLSPKKEESQSSWTNLTGSLLFHDNGRVVHYNGTSMLQWRSLRFNLQLSEFDTLGIGWVKSESTSKDNNDTGSVFFTLNGTKLEQALENVSAKMFPVVHIQKKNISVTANFGENPFRFVEGFNDLNIMCKSRDPINESYTETIFSNVMDTGVGNRRVNSISCRKPLSIKEFEIYNTQHNNFKTGLTNEMFGYSGSKEQFSKFLDNDSDSDSGGSDDEYDTEVKPKMSENSLLIKAWEAKVFPVIHRQFRNEIERSDGFEQIRGALALGMIDIARQTIDFLYEDIGGIPKDLKLPTLLDIKEAQQKLSIEQVKIGLKVYIPKIKKLPTYCVPVMDQTFGLYGEVVNIDSILKIVQVECYLDYEGVLVRFWYALEDIEKPPDHNSGTEPFHVQQINLKSSKLHKELLNMEFAMLRYFCSMCYSNLMKFVFSDLILKKELVLSSKDIFSLNVSLLRDIDIDNFLIVSNQLLVSPHRSLLNEDNIALGSENLLKNQFGSFASLFYTDTNILDTIFNYFLCNIENEEIIFHLTTALSAPIENPREYLRYEEIIINDMSYLKSYIQVSCAAFVITCVKSDLNSNDACSDICIQIQSVGGNQIKPNGQLSCKNIIQYPTDVRGMKEQESLIFKPIILRSDILRISHSGGDEESTNFTLYVYTIPPELPLCLLYLEKLLSQLNLDSFKQNLPKRVLNYILNIITEFLKKHDIPPILKEHMIMILSEYIKVYSSIYDIKSSSCWHQLLDFLMSIRDETLNLYHLESNKSRRVRYSRYLSTLLELCSSFHLYLTDEDCNNNFWYKTFMQNIGLLKWVRADTMSSSPDVLEYQKNKNNIHYKSDDNERLIVIKGFPANLDESTVTDIVEKALITIGGLIFDDIYIYLSNDSVSSNIQNETVGYVVLRLLSKRNLNKVIKDLEFQLYLRLYGEVENLEEGKEKTLTIFKVNESFQVSNSNVQNILNRYLRNILFATENYFSFKFNEVLTHLICNKDNLQSINLIETLEKIKSNSLLNKNHLIINFLSSLSKSLNLSMKDITSKLIEAITNEKIAKENDRFDGNNQVDLSMLKIRSFYCKYFESQISLKTLNIFKSFKGICFINHNLIHILCLNRCNLCFLLLIPSIVAG